MEKMAGIKKDSVFKYQQFYPVCDEVEAATLSKS